MLELTATADGSFTIYNSTVGENYHSKHGALQESKHVFLESGLIHFRSLNPRSEALSILEVGFGTGLNFLLSADHCSSRGIKLNYTGIEAFPLPEELLSQTGYSRYVNQEIWLAFLKSYPEALTKIITLNECCDYRIAETKLEHFNTDKLFDVLYFDAFAAVHQPGMWTEEALYKCCIALKTGGVFVTYAITGNLKRAMKNLGFIVEKAKGAPGKREMLRATKL